MTFFANESGFQAEGLFKQRVQWGTSGNAEGRQEYVGYAPPGSSESDSSWLIKKISYDANGRLIEVNIANGEASHDKKWSNLASYNYS